MRRLLSLAFLLAWVAFGQDAFEWTNDLPAGTHHAVRHETFHSAKNDARVGYALLPPPRYEADDGRRYPVLYYLHGGRPGGENKVVHLAGGMYAAMEAGKVAPMMVVFVNGGKLSHYDHEGSYGETAFVDELIPHIDGTHRTIARREARGVAGFSQGGRGTARIMFKHPELFAAAAPMGGGHQHEKRISENDGRESETLVISPPWNNTWHLAERYAARKDAPKMHILVVVGTEDQNYEANLEWSAHLEELGIEHRTEVLEGVPHSSRRVHEVYGVEILTFFADSFERALGKSW